jgi:phage FluMu protein Com
VSPLISCRFCSKLLYRNEIFTRVINERGYW